MKYPVLFQKVTRSPHFSMAMMGSTSSLRIEKREKVTLYGSVSWECGECPGLPSYTHNTLYICMYVCMYVYIQTYMCIYIGGVSKIGKVGVSLIPHFKFDK